MRPFDFRIEHRSISEFSTANTAKPKLDEADAKYLARLLDWGGWPFPVVVDANGRVAIGRARLEAAELFDFCTVPVVQIDQLKDGDLETFQAADARLAARANWGADVLARDFRHPPAPAKTEATIQPPRDAAVGEENQGHREPPPKTSVSKHGDIWRLGRHTLACGDARDSGLVAKVVENGTADLAFIDPPQNLLGEMPKETYVAGLAKVLIAARMATRYSGVVAIAMEWRRLELFLRMTAGGLWLRLRDFLIWTGAAGGLDGALYRSGCKVICVFRFGDGPHINNADLASPPSTNVFTDAADPAFPNTPPPALLARWIEDATSAGGIIVDLFAYSGSTLFAAERTGRSARLVEISAKRCDALLERFHAETGIEATLDGVPLHVVAKERRPAS